MDHYNFKDEFSLKTKIDEVIEILESIEKKNNKKILEFNRTKLFPIFVDRR